MYKYSVESEGVFQILLLLCLLVPAILFLLTQHKTLQRIKVENRGLAPGLVWIGMIPFFGQLWQFIVVTRISSAIKVELRSREEDSILGFSDSSAVEEHGKRPTYYIGIAYCSLIAIAFVMQLTSYTQFVLFFSFPGMICWIIYWVQLSSYKRKLSVVR